MKRGPHATLLTLLCLLGLFLQASAQEERVLFSSPGGFYDESFQLTLECFYPNHHVRFTTNGNTPTPLDRRFEQALWLDERLYSQSDIHTIQITPDGDMFYPGQVQKCIVIRAAVFDENDRCVSPTATNTYFIRSLGNDAHGLPLVSLCADSLDLFDYHRGIFVPGVHFDPSNPKWSGNYHMRGREWEREVNVEFYEPDNTGINQRAGLRTHGGNGRRFQQKNMALYAREEYGKKRFKHPFFETLSINSFKRLQLKPFASSWTPAGLQDPLCQAIAGQALDVEALATRPVILFLNGEYWGIYYLHEKPDERYLEDHFDIDIDDCSIMGNWKLKCEHGNGDDFIEMMRGLEHADLSDPMEYSRVARFFDLDSFIDYQILELFLANTDWPSNNMRCWHVGNGPWRWIFYDGDACLDAPEFDVFANATYSGSGSWPSCSQATLLFRRLLANETFRSRFFDRFHELLGTRFQYAETHRMLLQVQDAIREEIPSQADRFGSPNNMDTWNQECHQIDDFLKERPSLLSRQLEDFIQAESWHLGEWQCYPNPFSDALYVTFQTDRPEALPIHIHDNTGRTVYSSRMAIHPGFNSITLEPALSPGTYILTIGEKTQILVKL